MTLFCLGLERLWRNSSKKGDLAYEPSTSCANVCSSSDIWLQKGVAPAILQIPAASKMDHTPGSCMPLDSFGLGWLIYSPFISCFFYSFKTIFISSMPLCVRVACVNSFCGVMEGTQSCHTMTNFFPWLTPFFLLHFSCQSTFGECAIM